MLYEIRNEAVVTTADATLAAQSGLNETTAPEASGPSEGADAAARKTSGDPALLRARIGRWRWYWVILGHIFLIALVGLGLGGVFVLTEYLLTTPWFGPAPDYGDKSLIYEPGKPLSFIIPGLMYVVMILGVIITLALVHGQSWRRALSTDKRFHWSHFARAAAAFVVTIGLLLALALYLDPQQFKLRSTALDMLPILALVALITVPQAFSEDIIFKGYFLRTWGAVLPYRLVVVSISALLFTSLHVANPDVAADPWFSLAAMVISDLVWIAVYLRTASLAAVTGLHWANNVFAMCLVTTIPGYDNKIAIAEYHDPVLLAGKSHVHQPMSWAILILTCLALYALLSWRRSPLYVPSAPKPAPPSPPEKIGDVGSA